MNRQGGTTFPLSRRFRLKEAVGPSRKSNAQSVKAAWFKTIPLIQWVKSVCVCFEKQPQLQWMETFLFVPVTNNLSEIRGASDARTGRAHRTSQVLWSPRQNLVWMHSRKDRLTQATESFALALEVSDKAESKRAGSVFHPGALVGFLQILIQKLFSVR